jgi:hypothetical protein
VGKKNSETLKGRCDSFVVKTNVHYPTDINLLFNAIQKLITLITKECKVNNLSGWRKKKSNIRKIKKQLYKIQNLKRSNSKNHNKKHQQEEKIKFAHQEYLNMVNNLYNKASLSLYKLNSIENVNENTLKEIEKYMSYVLKQMDLIERRVIKGEVIPHHEKIFSVFEEHTEWISKGKAGVPQELGLRVAIIEDQYQFILNHTVMEGLTDEKITVPFTYETIEKFPSLSVCSYDKGFYTPQNKTDLKEKLDKVVVPKKGKLSSKEKAEEHAEEFIKIKYQHSAIESAIGALDHRGLDKCPDHGIDGFKKYVALGILARNIQNLGNILKQKEIKMQRRRDRLKKNKTTSALVA